MSGSLHRVGRYVKYIPPYGAIATTLAANSFSVIITLRRAMLKRLSNGRDDLFF